MENMTVLVSEETAEKKVLELVQSVCLCSEMKKSKREKRRVSMKYLEQREDKLETSFLYFSRDKKDVIALSCALRS